MDAGYRAVNETFNLQERNFTLQNYFGIAFLIHLLLIYMPEDPSCLPILTAIS